MIMEDNIEINPVQEKAKDLSGAAAGDGEPDPEMNTVDALAKEVGLNLDNDEPLHTEEILEERDRNRLEDN
jgi:hypothetical protein